jgi:hypothetical protein
VNDLQGETGAKPENIPADKVENSARSTGSWMGRLALFLAPIAGGTAAGQFSGSLRYPGLVGVVALTGVLAATAWIRGLNPRARLPRYAPWFFMVPAACLATIAAFSTGSAVASLTVIAAVLTVGAVLITKELLSVARILQGVAFVAVGAAFVAGGPHALADQFPLMGISSIAVGSGFMAYGMATIADREALTEIARNVYAIASIPLAIAVTIEPKAHIGPTFGPSTGTPVKVAAFAAAAAIAAWWVSRVAGRVAVATGALITFGLAVIVIGTVALADRSALLGAAGIALGTAFVALGVAIISPRTIVARIRQVADWATEVPQGADSQKEGSETGKN